MNKKSTVTVKNTCIRLFSFLSKKRKLEILILLCITFFTSIAEICLITITLPFISFLTSSEKSGFDNFLINLFFRNLNNVDLNFNFIGSIFILVVISTAFLRVLTIRISSNLSFKIGSEIAQKLYINLLNSEFESFNKINSSEFIDSSTVKIEAVISGSVYFFQMILGLINSLSIIIALTFVSPSISIISFVIFSFVYFNIGLSSKRRIKNNSSIESSVNAEIAKIIRETFGTFRDLLLNFQQNNYHTKFNNLQFKLRNKQAESFFLATYPKFVFEAVGLTTISIFAMILASRNSSNNSILPLLGTFAIASQRLLPSLQLIFGGWASLKQKSYSINNVLNKISRQNLKIKDVEFEDDFVFKSIKFRGVNYKYQDNRFCLNNINLEIKSGEKIGIIGPTGAGKSTFIDLIMTFLNPIDGSILINNKQIHLNSKNSNLIKNSFRRSIALVPQNIFIMDANFISNIGFTYDEENLDMDRVIESAKLAGLHDYISNLPNSYQTQVGENGSKLSGGQKQRLAIARALYKPIQILVLDEATSALDQKTQSKVIENISKFGRAITLLMIAHRSSTLDKCDRIYQVKDNQVKII